MQPVEHLQCPAFDIYHIWDMASIESIDMPSGMKNLESPGRTRKMPRHDHYPQFHIPPDHATHNGAEMALVFRRAVQ